MAALLGQHAADGQTVQGAVAAPCMRGSSHGSIDVNGVTRTFMLYIPKRYSPGESALVIALHGRGGSGKAFEQSIQLDQKADEEGFAVAYPDGLVDSVGTANWNYFGDPYFGNSPPDDVGFVRALIDYLKVKIHPNRRRIYAAGTSAGGFMVQRLGVELSDRIAAIGVVEGELYVALNGPQPVPPAAAPVSVLFLKGDQDPFNQYCGILFPAFNATESSSDQDFEYWTGPLANQCEDVKPAAPLCESMAIADAQGHIVTPGTLSAIVTKTASECKRHTAVRFYRLLGGGDVWNLNPLNIPGSVPFNPDLNARTGVTTNAILWKFFAEHPKAEADE